MSNRVLSGHHPGYKRVTAGAALLILALWVAHQLLSPVAGAEVAGTGIALGAAAPEFELKTIDGKAYKLSDLRGQAVLINFFATWCPPCKREMPILQEAYQEYRDQGIIVLAVNLNESDVAIRSFQEKLGTTFPIVVDKDDQVSRLYDIVPLPTTYFVDRKGIVQAKWTGELRKEQLRSLLAKIL